MKRTSQATYIFFFAQDYRPMTPGWQGAPCFRRCGRRLVSKPTISWKKSWGSHRRTTIPHLRRSTMDRNVFIRKVQSLPRDVTQGVIPVNKAVENRWKPAARGSDQPCSRLFPQQGGLPPKRGKSRPPHRFRTPSACN